MLNSAGKNGTISRELGQDSMIIFYFDESLEDRQPDLESLLECSWLDLNHVLFDMIPDFLNLSFNIHKYFSAFFLSSYSGIRKKEQIRGFKFRYLFTYSHKELHLKKRRMLLVNMKKVMNNFWAWVRTHTIFYIPKMFQKIKEHFLSLRTQAMQSIFTKEIIGDSKERLAERHQDLAQQTLQNNARIARKDKWFHEQNILKQQNDPKYKEKAYKIQLKEYNKYKDTQKHLIIATNNTNKSINETKEKEKEKEQPKDTNFIQYVTNSLLTAAYNRFISLYKNMSAARTTIGALVMNMKEEITKFNKEAFYLGLKIPYKYQRRIQYARRKIKKQYLPTKRFKRLEKLFKRNRIGLFQRVREILAEQQSRRLLKPLLRYTVKAGAFHAFSFWNDYIAKFKEKYTQMIRKPLLISNVPYFLGDIFAYQINQFNNNLVSLCIAEALPKEPKETAFQFFPELKQYIKTNLIELKRMLRCTSFGH